MRRGSRESKGLFRSRAALLAVLWCAACSGGTSTGTTSTVGTSGTISAGASSGAQTSSGGVSTSSTSSGAASGTTSGGPWGTCTGNFGFVEGSCLATSCKGLGPVPCALGDAGVGACFGGTCQTPAFTTDPLNCGGLGQICPSDTSCQNGLCLNSLRQPSSCPVGACPEGRLCSPDVLFCIALTCGNGTDGELCAFDAGVLLGQDTCCGTSCTSLETDSANCGACGAACGTGSVCIGGSCWVTSCQSTTAVNQGCALDGGLAIGACCGEQCVDPGSDALNCGGCGLTCSASDAGGCISATCALPCGTETPCPAGSTCIAGACLAESCAARADGGGCALLSGGSLAAGECCADVCVNPEVDPLNCGACGAACPVGQSCSGAFCVATPPVTCATAANGTACLSQGVVGECCGGSCTLADDLDCGGCGAACPSGSQCAPFATVPGCATNGELAACADLDCPANTACASLPTSGFPACLPTVCTPSAGALACSVGGGVGTCCSSQCVGDSDPRNCGGCGQICPNGFTCSTGACVFADAGAAPTCAAAGCPDDLACFADAALCLPTDCAAAPDGRLCVAGGPGLGFQTGLGLCCGGACVDASQSPENCGACGAVCASGVCADTSSGGVCLPTVTDPSCAESCPAGSFCWGTVCWPSICEAAGQTCVSPDGAAGLCCLGLGPCADLATDPANCGSCGVRCPGAQTCVEGVCSGTPAPCNAPGLIGHLCDLDAGLSDLCCPGIGCVDVATDPDNCGNCGASCAQGETCVGGSCGAGL